MTDIGHNRLAALAADIRAQSAVSGESRLKAPKKTAGIGEEGWRPTQVHPLAALFPMLAPDDFDALVEDIKENGQCYPIALAEDGTLIDGRMRLAACEKAGIEPWYEFINGEDPVALIWSVNGKRRHMSKGQMAMIAAMGLDLSEANRSGSGIDRGISKAAKAAGVSQARLSQAIAVREHAPHLVQEVIDGKPGISLDKAHADALAIKREKDWREDGVRMLQKEDRDLAQRVIDGELSLEDGRKALETRRREQEAVRDSVLIGLSHGIGALVTFQHSEVLPTVAKQLKNGDGLEHLKRYFPNGIEELGEKIAAAKAGLSEIERLYKQINGTRGPV